MVVTAVNADSELVGDGTAIPKFRAPCLVMTFQINPSVDIFTPFTINNSVFAHSPAKHCGNSTKHIEWSKYVVQPLKLDSEDL